ncbi:MAG: AIR synthase family protein [archaeon GB-1867-005]|nr:AIR synthase family protein [Candidatus Culexmicrobium cathedralense]
MKLDEKSKLELPLGKLSPDVLESLVFNRIGVDDPRVLVKPKIGEDAAIIDFGDRVLVLHSDPITGAIENIGWLAVNVSSNDVATRGAKPKWISMVILLPENADSQLLDEITKQIDDAAKKLGIMIVCGHTEVTPGLNRPILISTAIGEASKDKYVTTSGARVGDKIILTKGAAIEGTAIFAYEFEDFLKAKLGADLVERAKKYIELISVLKEAMIAVEVGGVTAMHDPTEGGVLGGLQELAKASNVGFRILEEKVIINAETEGICKVLGADPLQTISSGSMIITSKPSKADEIVEALRNSGIKASIIGEVVEEKEGMKLIRRDGSVLTVREPVQDHLWVILSSRNDLKKKFSSLL